MFEVFLCFIEHLNIQKLSDITKAIPMFFKGIAYFFILLSDKIFLEY